MRTVVDPAECAFAFGVLAVLMAEYNKKHGFPTTTGERRHNVDTGEFMVMTAKGETPHHTIEYHFKHRYTREYVVARREYADPAAEWYLKIKPPARFDEMPI